MKRVMCLVVAVISVFVYGLALAAPGTGGGSAPVTVVNTDANPVPVTGNLGISGTADVNVTNPSIQVTGAVGITGTPNVNVNNTVPVSITNTPVPVTTGEKEPIALKGGCDTGFNVCGDDDVYTVPTGKRLVVEYFSCSSQLGIGQGLTCRIWNSGSSFVPVYLPTSPLSPGPPGMFIATGQQVKLYAAADEEIFVSVATPGPFSENHVDFYIIGYLEDAP